MMLNEKALVDQYLKETDRKLLIQLYDRKITPEEAAKITKDYDIDTASYEVSSLLAKLGMNSDFTGFRSDLVPRLRGLYSYHQTRRNVNRPKYVKLIDLLNQSGIDTIAGFYLSLETKYSREMYYFQYRFDIIVHTKDFEAAKKLTANDEQTFRTEVTVNEEPYLWDSSVETEYYGRRLRVLSPNGMVLVYAKKLQDSGYEDLFREMNLKLQWLYAFRAIDAQEGGIDPAKLRELCEEKDKKLYYTIRFLLACAFTYYGYTNRLKRLDEEMPVGKDYLLFLSLIKVFGRYGVRISKRIWPDENH